MKQIAVLNQSVLYLILEETRSMYASVRKCTGTVNAVKILSMSCNVSYTLRYTFAYVLRTRYLMGTKVICMIVRA